MFNNEKYVTSGITATVPAGIQVLLWYLVTSLEISSKDYLQVFRLSERDGNQVIVHSQEEPDYTKEYVIPVDELMADPITAKIYVIDDGDHSTMLLAEEY